MQIPGKEREKEIEEEEVEVEKKKQQDGWMDACLCGFDQRVARGAMSDGHWREYLRIQSN